MKYIEYFPEPEQPEIFDECIECGCEIYEGDDYYDFEDGPVCEDCLIEYAYKKKKTAKGVA
ncbi:MAG: hypothetical protein GX763_07890 [Clostridiaceae bacterium]|nr:hypothetical protein [Clostridiaceae bacterium]